MMAWMRWSSPAADRECELRGLFDNAMVMLDQERQHRTRELRYLSTLRADKQRLSTRLVQCRRSHDKQKRELKIKLGRAETKLANAHKELREQAIVFEEDMKCTEELLEEAIRDIAAITEEKNDLAIELNTRIEEFKAMKDQLAMSDQHKDQEISRLIREKESLMAQVSQLTNEKNSLGEQLSASSQRNSVLNSECSQLRHEKDSLSAHMSQLEEEKQSMDLENGNLNTQVVQLREEKTELLNQLAESKEEQNVLFDMLTKRNKEITALKNMVNEREDELEIKGSQIEDLTTELARHRGSFDTFSWLRRKELNHKMNLRGTIRVYARVKPSKRVESSRVHSAENSVVVRTSVNRYGGVQEEETCYPVDLSFEGPSQLELFDHTQLMVRRFVEQENIQVCIFAYGQTSSGKTFTMFGDEKNPGLVPRSLEILTSECKDLTVSAVEIYNDQVFDVLTKGAVTCFDHSTGMDRSIKMPIDSAEKAQKVVARAMDKRRTASTMKNDSSSRSHMILSFHKSGGGRLSFVDLAGSENFVAERDDKQMKEGSHINKSLKSLKDMLIALREGREVIPYRDSRLNFFLKDCFVGDTNVERQVLLIVNVSSDEECASESKKSLEFGCLANEVSLREKKTFKSIKSSMC
jgi:myosin heavy subunit